MELNKTPDYLIVGAGIVGLTIARELKTRFPRASVTLLEKESKLGLHASGRNSGVVHAGFYYSPDSLKAKMTRRGNILMTAYCKDRNLKINQCGKLVVAKNEDDLASLEILRQRAIANNVPIQVLDERDALSIEPRVKTFQKALYSPTTSSIDPLNILESLKTEVTQLGVHLKLTQKVVRTHEGTIVTSNGDAYSPGYVINAAGLYADQLAKQFGFSDDYKILPFKGLYLYSNEAPGSLRTLIYPVPDLKYPFLGVHFTITVDGHTKIGPTAIPAFWREQYHGWDQFRLSELVSICVMQLKLVCKSNFDFKKLIFTELKKYSRSELVRLGKELLNGVEESQYQKWGRPGIRAQLLNIKTGKLEMDFVCEGDKKSLHVLNAVSPALTCSFAFAEYICDVIEKKRS